MVSQAAPKRGGSLSVPVSVCGEPACASTCNTMLPPHGGPEQLLGPRGWQRPGGSRCQEQGN